MSHCLKALAYLLDYFPKIELPLSLSEQSISLFSKENTPLPNLLVDYILEEWEQSENTGFEEIIPCCQLPPQEDFHTIIYLKMGLLSQEFILATLQIKTHELINKKVIAGLVSNGRELIRSAATIEHDLMVHITVGTTQNDSTFDPLNTEAFYMEVLPGGNIYTQKEENPLAWLNEKNTKKS